MKILLICAIFGIFGRFSACGNGSCSNSAVQKQYSEPVQKLEGPVQKLVQAPRYLRNRVGNRLVFRRWGQ